MRASTRNIVTSIGLGTIAMSYVIGMNSATASSGFSASGLSTGDSSSTASAPNATASSSMTSAASPSETATAQSSAAPTPSSSSSSSAKKKSTSSSGSTSSSAGTSVTISGEAIAYQYGTVQVSVTKVSGKITDVTLLQASATHGREGAFSPLVQAALQAQGSNFGNLSGATYTTDAFKQALDSALSKF